MPLIFAQNKPGLKVNVPFEFVARGKTFPAGVYVFSSEGSQTVSMKSVEGRASLQLPVITALARSNNDDDHLLAFDKVNDKRVLSEVWLVDRDGALVHVTPGDHAHDVIRLRAGAPAASTGMADRRAR